jgi:glycosyltransferase involved in cell wall biosynthesis
MTSSTPEVTVVIPAFNAEHTLGEQLAALSRQAVPFGWEILVCDNGSRDATVKVVQAWQERMAHVRLVDASARRGPGAARNIGAAEANAALLLFCDADDVVADDWLHEMHQALQESDFVAGGRRYSVLNAKATGPADWEAPLFTKPFLPQLPAATSSNLGVKAVVFRKVGGFDESLPTAEDIDLCWRIQLEGHPLVGRPEAIVHIRRRASLAAVFKQAYAYGAGDRMIQHKYSDVIASSRLPGGIAGASVQTTTSEPVRPRPLSRIWRKVLRRRSRVDLTFAVDRLARRLGGRFGASGPLPSRVPVSGADKARP